MGRRYFRKNSGRFRSASLTDFGMACCEKCGTIFSPVIREQNGFIDPKDFREAQRLCPECGGNPESEATGLQVNPQDPLP